MSLDYAILGFLNHHPLSGYDLKKVFDTSVQHFWPADQSQIYRTLSKLEENSLVTVEKIQQEDRPDRKVYHITAAGREELLQWLSGPTPLSRSRNAALIQVFFSAQLSDEQVLAKFEEFADNLHKVLEQYDSIPELLQPFLKSEGSPREEFFWMLTLENGIYSAKANLEWAESVIRRLKNGEVPKE